MHMNKQQLIHSISDQTGLNLRQVRLVINCLVSTTTEVLQEGDSLILQRFGALHPVRKNERPGRNPRTGEPKPVSARTIVRFKMGCDLQNTLNSEKQAAEEI